MNKQTARRYCTKIRRVQLDKAYGMNAVFILMEIQVKLIGLVWVSYERYIIMTSLTSRGQSYNLKSK